MDHLQSSESELRPWGSGVQGLFSLLSLFLKDSILKKKKPNKQPDILILVYLRMQASELALLRQG